MAQSHDPTAHNDPPKDDGNFLHVVIYAGIALVVAFLLAFLVLSSTGRKLVPGKHHPHPTSQLQIPGAKELPSTAQNANESPFIFLQQMDQTSV